MKKITIRMDDDFFEKINARSNKTGCKTISQCARELIDLGLRIEAAASSQGKKNDEDGVHPLLLNMVKTNMIWSLEARLLARFLLEHNSNLENSQGLAFMDKAKKSAATHVEKLIQEMQKT